MLYIFIYQNSKSYLFFYHTNAMPPCCPAPSALYFTGLTLVLIEMTFPLPIMHAIGPSLQLGVTSIHPGASLRSQIGGRDNETQQQSKVLSVRIQSITT